MTVDVAVLGRGLWGTAAAMHLARAGATVALIGPDEPEDAAAHDGPFGSHFDAGRITRSIALETVWARLTTASISRYAALEAESGISFYTPCGGMMASDDPAYSAQFLKVSRDEGLAFDTLSGAALSARFPMFSFPDGTVTAWDATGGVIDPRAMRRAHETLAVRAGARIIRDVAAKVAETGVHCTGGADVAARQVLIATGAYAGLAPVTEHHPALSVAARTIFFAEVAPAEAKRLRDMPSLIWQPAGLPHYFYLLPPIRYPDGKLWIKIGGEPNNRTVTSADAARDWFRTEGSAEVGQMLQQGLRRLMPDLAIRATATAPCILAHSTTGAPYIQRLSDSVVLATGCCGAGAKCADEIGRLAAETVMGADPAHAGAGADFRAVLA